jgi:hypothetical protein
MGNSFSTNNSKNNSKNKSPNNTIKEFSNFYEVIDTIATYYILTMDFKSLSKLADKEYCDKLVIITSDIIKNYFNDLEITYLAQRIEKGEEVNKLSKENEIFVNKDELESLDVKNDSQKSIRKKRICIGIAKFYVKIAHIFAAIVKTINPVYVYKENGTSVKKTLLEKDTIPKGIKKTLYKLNICDNRIRNLRKLDVDENKQINLHPKICDFNLDKKGNVKTLNDEPGITELMQLYLDDKYDYSTGVFIGMSDSTKRQFQKDLKIFYTAFTGNEDMPPEIQKFSDIKLRDYNNKNSCQGENPVFKQNYILSENDKLFVEYAKNIKDMIQTASNNQDKLLSVINELFIFVNDPYSDKKKIRVNPKLTEEYLQQIVEKTRKIIIELYVKCELDYVNGIKLYEAIVESKILETTKKQIDNLEKKATNIVTETNMKVVNNTNNLPQLPQQQLPQPMPEQPMLPQMPQQPMLPQMPQQPMLPQMPQQMY